MEKIEYKWLGLSDEEIVKSFDTTRKSVLTDTGLENVFEIKNAEQLQTLIKSYKKISYANGEDDFFKSKNHRVAYYLTNIDRQTDDIYLNELGISRVTYKEEAIAKKWKVKMVNIFHSDKFTYSFDTQDVMSAVNKIYKRLVGKA
ncbi:hypothetical protein [Aliivibrio sifiae]|uniref:hypothetical protein n=1 Tax=Aliivibrio sifiae TaxID=566293 RepID=UPI003D0D408D